MEELINERRKILVDEARRIGKEIRKIDYQLLNKKQSSRGGRPKYYRPPNELDLARVNLIIDIVCEVFKIDEVSLLSPSRKREYVKPRQCVFYIASLSCACSLKSLGAMLGTHSVGGFDHATIIYGRDCVKEAIYMKEKKNIDPDGYVSLVEKCIAIYMQKKHEL